MAGVYTVIFHPPHDVKAGSMRRIGMGWDEQGGPTGLGPPLDIPPVCENVPDGIPIVSNVI